MVMVVNSGDEKYVVCQDGDIRIHLKFWPTDVMTHDEAQEYAFKAVLAELDRMVKNRKNGRI
jgi:hypothetical protein